MASPHTGGACQLQAILRGLQYRQVPSLFSMGGNYLSWTMLELSLEQFIPPSSCLISHSLSLSNSWFLMLKLWVCPSWSRGHRVPLEALRNSMRFVCVLMGSCTCLWLVRSPLARNTATSVSDRCLFCRAPMSSWWAELWSQPSCPPSWMGAGGGPAKALRSMQGECDNGTVGLNGLVSERHREMSRT